MKLWGSQWRVSINERFKYNYDKLEAHEKRIGALESQLSQLERENDWLTKIRFNEDDYGISAEYGHLNLFELSSPMRQILNYLGLKAKPPNRQGWSITKQETMKTKK